ncbi:hypothetical protein [Mycolicibacterium mageritense]|uniref:hypothetical protein n=1 Tax=Mycolicibacterium mageritense TaxID=53462 RepID=UPI00093E0C3D|nr:hypothetical protein [Mycolicibacterium mageritense]OKH65402.1 hypothetical protein EB73_21930 [Mycobacterium sp. SWH-M3]TXI56241.1 MAG: hypothetical protein E6Q55_29605 [Mycolicibacterium mageritense]
MAFKVYLLADETQINNYGDSSTYQFLPDGMLEVTEAGTDMIQTFSPTGWARVIADDDHRPGYPKGEGDPLATVY